MPLPWTSAGELEHRDETLDKLLNHEQHQSCEGCIDSNECKCLPRSQFSLRSVYWLSHARYIFGFALLLIAFVFIWIISKPHPTDLHNEILMDDGKSFPLGHLTWSNSFEPLPCGTNPQEALARGCHFDIIATAWLPPKCIDNDLVTEFEASYPWVYFRNPNGTDPYPRDHDLLGSQNTTIWTTFRWHVAHCLYMWKKLNRALVQGHMTDGETITQAHTDHCSSSILQMQDPDAIIAIVEIIYPPC
jgi:hypothetical protein